MLRRMAFPTLPVVPTPEPCAGGPLAGWPSRHGDLLIRSSRDRDMGHGEAAQGGGGEPHKNRVTVPSHVPGAPLVMLAVSVWFSGGLLYS